MKGHLIAPVKNADPDCANLSGNLKFSRDVDNYARAEVRYKSTKRRVETNTKGNSLAGIQN